MDTYCISCKKNTASKNSTVRRTKQNKLMFDQVAMFVATKNRSSLKIRNTIK